MNIFITILNEQTTFNVFKVLFCTLACSICIHTFGTHIQSYNFVVIHIFLLIFYSTILNITTIPLVFIDKNVQTETETEILSPKRSKPRKDVFCTSPIDKDFSSQIRYFYPLYNKHTFTSVSDNKRRYKKSYSLCM